MHRHQRSILASVFAGFVLTASACNSGDDSSASSSGGSSNPNAADGGGEAGGPQKSGDLDRTFAGDGVAEIPASGLSPDVWTASIVDPDGKVVVAVPTATKSTAVFRFTAGGALDDSFGTKGRAEVPAPWVLGHPTRLGLQQDGKLLVGVDSSAPGGFGAVVRLTTTGAIDTSFGTQGYAMLTESGLQALVVLADGKVLAASKHALHRFTAQGMPDTAFAGAGSMTIERCAVLNSSPTQRVPFTLHDLAVQSTGKVLVFASCPEGQLVRLTVRVTTDGKLDTTYGALDPYAPQQYVGFFIAYGHDRSYAEDSFFVNADDTYTMGQNNASGDLNSAQVYVQPADGRSYEKPADARELQVRLGPDFAHYDRWIVRLRPARDGKILGIVSQGLPTYVVRFSGYATDRVMPLDTSFGGTGYVAVASDSTDNVHEAPDGKIVVVSSKGVARYVP